MAYNSVGSYQVQEVIRDKPEFAILKHRRKEEHPFILPTKDHFPKPKEPSKELLELRKISGSVVPEVGKEVTLKNLPVRTYSKAVSSPSTTASKSTSQFEKKGERPK